MLLQRLAKILFALGIQAVVGFVQQPQRAFAQQYAGQAQPPALPLGQAAKGRAAASVNDNACKAA